MASYIQGSDVSSTDPEKCHRDEGIRRDGWASLTKTNKAR